MKLMNRWSFEEDKIDAKPWKISLLLSSSSFISKISKHTSLPCHAFVL